MEAAPRIAGCIFYFHQNKTNVTDFSHNVIWNKSWWTFEANVLLCGCKDNCEVFSVCTSSKAKSQKDLWKCLHSLTSCAGTAMMIKAPTKKWRLLTMFSMSDLWCNDYNDDCGTHFLFAPQAKDWGPGPAHHPKNVCTTSKTNDPAPLSCKWGQL